MFGGATGDIVLTIPNGDILLLIDATIATNALAGVETGGAIGAPRSQCAGQRSGDVPTLSYVNATSVRTDAALRLEPVVKPELCLTVHRDGASRLAPFYDRATRWSEFGTGGTNRERTYRAAPASGTRGRYPRPTTSAPSITTVSTSAERARETDLSARPTPRRKATGAPRQDVVPKPVSTSHDCSGARASRQTGAWRRLTLRRPPFPRPMRRCDEGPALAQQLKTRSARWRRKTRLQGCWSFRRSSQSENTRLRPP